MVVAHMTLMLGMNLEERGKRGWSQATKSERNGTSVEARLAMVLSPRRYPTYFGCTMPYKRNSA